MGWRGCPDQSLCKNYWQPGSTEPAKRKAINTIMETAIKLLNGFGLGRVKCGPMLLDMSQSLINFVRPDDIE